jgi:tagatose 1,6-diphosphate aldolase GatY/KbaY
MLESARDLLAAATDGGYAVGAFNVYNLEGVRAVISAAEELRSPAILQLHPGALSYGGQPLVALCLAAAREAAVPVGVHLDHSSSEADIRAALDAGVRSVMADGSHLPYELNMAFTRQMVRLAHARGTTVEAEVGRLSGSEDGLTVEEYEAKLTDPAEAARFVERTGADCLAVCIGNVHGRYRKEPSLDFERLGAIRAAVPVPLVLHGASGLPTALVRRAIGLGVCKLNVNTEVREAYVAALEEKLASGSPSPDLLELMRAAEGRMRTVVAAKLELFGSAGAAPVRGGG